MAVPIFKTKEVKIDTLGEYLVSVRKQLNLEVKTVSLLTQIRLSYLEALESGDFEKMPAEVYVRGFLKSLADFYHIKEKVLIDQYEKERGFESDKPVKAKPINIQWSLTPKTIIFGISGVIGLFAIIYVGFQIRSVLASPLLEVYEPADNLVVLDSTIVVSGIAEIGADVFLNNQPVLTDSAGQFNETLVLSRGLNVIEILERNKFGKESRVVRQVTAQELNEVLPVESVVNLTINIGPEPTWVFLEADGIVVQRGTMLAGSSKVVTAREQIILTSADAGSTQVIYNGEDLGKLGRSGEVIRNVEFSNPVSD
jgi:cytoskeleton protein RodZ